MTTNKKINCLNFIEEAFFSMKLDLKNIHIGNLIQTKVNSENIEMNRICNFFHCSEQDVSDMYEQSDLSTELLLKWSKLLEYDFFRLYSQHLILFSPQKGINTKTNTTNALPVFRKNLYTKEIIAFTLELIRSGKKTKSQIINEYNIPKTTLYKWIEKY